MLQARKQTISAKVEGVYGNDSAPTTANVIDIFGVDYTPDGDPLEREILSDTLSEKGHIIGMKWQGLKFSTELRGSGSAGTAPEVDALWQMCAFTKSTAAGSSVVYTLNSLADPVSGTIYYDRAGKLHKLTGARGDIEIKYSAGKFGVLSWDFMSLYNTPTDGSIGAKTGSEVTAPPMLKACTFSIGGYSLEADEFTIKLGNELTRFASLNATQAIKEIVISARKPTGSISAEDVLLATHDYFADWENATKSAWTIQAGSTGGNIVLIEGYTQIKSIKYKEANGISYYNFEIRFPKNVNAGNDELKVTYK